MRPYDARGESMHYRYFGEGVPRRVAAAYDQPSGGVLVDVTPGVYPINDAGRIATEIVQAVRTARDAQAAQADETLVPLDFDEDRVPAERPETGGDPWV